MSARLRFPSIQIRWVHMKQKSKVFDELDEVINRHEMKHRNHPGVIRPRQIESPKWLLGAAQEIIKDERLSKQAVVHAGEKLERHLLGRHPPQEVDQNAVEKLYCGKEKNVDIKDLPPRLRLQPKIYNWQQIPYDKKTGLAYLSSMGVPEYLTLSSIFREIQYRDPDFTPTNMFDFASGIGTAVWAAANLWKSIEQYVCIDTSPDMIALAEQIMEHHKPHVKNIFYRQHLPVAPIPTYDLVVSAYGLLDLPGMKSRLDTLSKLWLKAAKYFVIVEHGTNAGFQMVNEARDFILKFAANSCDKSRDVHIFAPCPHDLKCPRYWYDETPCNFTMPYFTLPLSGTSKPKQHLYSYVVFKKGEYEDGSKTWPRIVRPVLKKSSHVICRWCDKSGHLKEEVFTTYKNGKNTYRCARISKWGDRLPFESVEVQPAEPVGGQQESDNDHDTDETDGNETDDSQTDSNGSENTTKDNN